MVNISKFLLKNIGLPIGLIVVGGLILNKYRSGIVSSAGNIGSVLGDAVSTPISEFINSFRNLIPSFTQSSTSQYTQALPNATGVDYIDYVRGNDTRTTSEVNDWYTNNNIINPASYGDNRVVETVSPGNYYDALQEQGSSDSPEGWYYRNFEPGGRADDQIRLDQGTADRLIDRGFDLTFLSSSESLPSGLSDAGFAVWGRSRGYQ